MVETCYTCGQWAGVSCIPESGCCFIFLHLFPHFLSLNFQTLKYFVTLFSGTVRPRRLKLCTHMDRGQMFCVYRNEVAAAYLSLYVSFFFLSNFQKRPRGRAVSSPDFSSQGRWFESRWRRDSSRT